MDLSPRGPLTLLSAAIVGKPSDPMFIPARLATLATLCLSMISAPAADDSWKTDFEAARKEAADSDKILLIDFTGSDWCAWCIKLRKEVFAQAEFETGVKEKFVLVELDYPKDKARVTEAVAKQNEALLKQYPIKAYPTVLLCDAAGKPFATTGYRPDGPKAYVTHLDELLAKKATRDKSFAEAASKDGVEKAKLLVAALNGLELDSAMINANYTEIAAEIKAADPSDETGFAKKQADEIKLATFLMKLGELRSKQDFDGALKMIQDTLADSATQGDFRQQVYGHYAGTLAYANKKDEAIEVLKKAVAEAPEGPRTKELQEFIVILEREKAGLPPAVVPAKKD